MSEEQVQEHTHEGGGAPKWHKRLIIALMVIVGVSVAARVLIQKDKPQPQAAAAGANAVDDDGNPLMPSRLTSGNGTGATVEPQVEDPSTTEKVLPFVTEGGIAMLIGTM
ncbi:MAG: hypothetical protein OER88_07230, partial [Planctomycetota bacterium]|nr:hypothetical protein [Planctomycetota bacterium]